MNKLAYTIDSTDTGFLTGELGAVQAGANYSELIANIIAKIDTRNKLTIFNVVAQLSGENFVIGHLYGHKLYGAGIFMKYDGSMKFWNLYNGVVTVYEITKTVEV